MSKITVKIDGNTVTIRKKAKTDLNVTEIQEALQDNRWLRENGALLLWYFRVREDSYAGYDFSMGQEQNEWALTMDILEDEQPCPVCGKMHENFFNQGYEAAKQDAKSILAADGSLADW